jgi:uncharacterized protein (TIGR01244 family)
MNPATIGIPNEIHLAETLILGGQPDADALSRAREAGIKAIINLRPAAEDPAFDTSAAAQQLGLDYYALPVATAADLNPGTVKRFDALLADLEGVATLVHCASGNRVGALFALRAGWLQGASTTDALAFGQRAGLTSLAAAVQAKLQQPPV